MPVGTDPSPWTRHRSFLAVLAIVLATFICYWPAARSGFIWDDDTSLTANHLIKSPSGLRDIWFSARPVDYFPLTFTSFWFEWRLWGHDPAGYHIVNVLLHAASAVLLWRVLWRLKIPGAWLAGLIFTVHPLCVASVAWVAERKNTLSMFFCLLSALWFLRSQSAQPDRSIREKPLFHLNYYALSLAAFFLALLSKTSVVTLPFVFLLCLWWLRRSEWDEQLAPSHTRLLTFSDALRVAPFLLLSLATGFLTIWFQTHRAMGGESATHDSLLVRLLGGSRAVWFYLRKILWPTDLSMIYPRWNIDPRSPLAYIPALLIVGTLVVFWRYRRTWGTPPLLAFLSFLFLLLPVLGSFDMYFLLYSQVADHWTYLALIPIIALVVSTLARVVPGFTSVRTQYALALVLTVPLALLTFRQCSIYKTPETLWRATLAKNPSAWPAWNNLGNAATDPEEAVRCYQKALQLKPDYATAHNNIGAILASQGNFEAAVGHFREAVQLSAGYAHAHNNLGSALLDLHRTDEAVSEFQTAMRLNSDYPDPHNNLGRALVQQGKLAEAIAEFSEALRLNPDYADAHSNMGNALLSRNKLSDASPHFLAVLKLRPDSPEAHYQLGIILAAQKQTREAVPHLRKAINLRPGWVEALNNLAWILATEDTAHDGSEAVRLAGQAVALTATNSAGALDTLAAAYAQDGQFAAAVQTATRAIELALAAGQHEIATQVQSRLPAYKAGRPFRE